MTLFQELNNLMVEHYFKPNRKLSQNFLINEKIIEKMIELAELNDKDIVLEIGAGTGFVTRELLKKAKKVIAIEFDEALIPILEKLPQAKLEIINENFLTLSLPKFNKIVCSPPYGNSAEIMEKILFSEFETAVVLFQKEFIEKLLAFPGFAEFNDLSVLTQYFCEAKSVLTVSPASFFPTPNAFSSILVLKRKKVFGTAKNEKLFYFFLKTIFRYKNKNLENALINAIPFISKQTKIDKKSFEEKIHSIKLKGEKVAQIDCKDFVKTFNELF